MDAFEVAAAVGICTEVAASALSACPSATATSVQPCRSRLYVARTDRIVDGFPAVIR